METDPSSSSSPISRRNSDNNLEQDETMMEPHNHNRIRQSQTAGLSSSPDDDNSNARDSQKTQPRSNVNNSGSGYTSSQSQSTEGMGNLSSRRQEDEDDSSHEKDDGDWDEEYFDNEEEEKEAGAWDGNSNTNNNQDGDDPVGYNQEQIGGFGGVRALNQPVEEEIVFDRVDNSGGGFVDDERMHSYHSSLVSDSENGRILNASDPDDTENSPSFAVDDSDIFHGIEVVPVVWTGEDEYLDREEAPSGDEVSDSMAGLEYDNVEFDGCMGRLVFTDEELQFYRFEAITFVLSWDEVAKRQVSPPTYGIPMLRIKSTSNENHMFRLADQQMADLMRDDLMQFQVAGAPPPPPMSNDNGTNEAPRYKHREHASFLVGGETAMGPVDDDDKSEVSGEITDSYHDEDDEKEIEQLAVPKPRKKKNKKNRKSRKPRRKSNWSDDDSDEEIVDMRRSSHVVRVEAREEAMKERDQLIKEQKIQEEHEQDLKSWIFWTCCCTAILFLIIGGVSGYFIGTEMSGNSSDAEPMVAPPTQAPETGVPTPLPIEATPGPSRLPTNVPTVAPTENSTPTSQPTLRYVVPPNVIPPNVTDTETDVPTDADETMTTSQPTPQPTSSPGEEPTVDAPGATDVPSFDDSTQTLRPTVQETPAPSEAESMTLPPTVNTALLELLRDVSPDEGEALDTLGSPQQEALLWMETEDQIQADLSETKQIQRHSVVTFYFSTGGPDVWDASLQERQGEGSWLDPSTDDCEWQFIVCNQDGEIVALELMPPNGPVLMGTLPPEIGLFSALKDFVIATGNGAEAAEARQSQREQMVEFRVGRASRASNDTATTTSTDMDYSNDTISALLTGPLPSEIGNLVALENLLITNQGLTGELPKQVGSMTSIISFDLTNNQFASTVPWELGNLPQLEQLRLGFNSFGGRLEPEMFEQENGLAQSLSGLFLNNNQLAGPLPTTLGLLTSLQTGLFLESNRLTGTLPTELANVVDILVFRVDSNELEGEIPGEFRKWNDIAEFQVQATGFSGEMPEDLCRLFLVQGTQSYANCDRVACRCCVYCCDDDGTCTQT